MDTLTHAVSGALLVRATGSGQALATPSLNWRLLAGALGATFPDADFGLRLIDTLTYLNWHQGPTHSLVLMPLWALPIAWLCARLSRGRYKWQRFYIPVCGGIAIHIAGDVVTAYGPMLLSPFSDQRYFIPLLFLFDPVFTVIAITGLIVAFMLPAGGRYYALGALLLLAIYTGWQGALLDEAIAGGRKYARAQGLNDAKIHALPQPPYTFNWKILVAHDGFYDEAFVNLRRDRTMLRTLDMGFLQRLDAAYAPLADATWQRHARFGNRSDENELARQAWQQPALAPFRRFAMFPVLDHVERKDNNVCVWFADLRFSLPVIPPSYRFGLCREDDDIWQLERLRGAFWID